MMYKLSFLATMMAITLSGCATQSTHWDYRDAGRWSELNSEFLACAGKNQSPVDIANVSQTQLEKIQFNYNKHASTIVNNGHTVKLNFPAGDAINVEKNAFHLKQLHFHTPSEHTFSGKRFAAEIHLVHQNPQGELAVVAVMVAEGAKSGVFNKLIRSLPSQTGKSIDLKQPLQASDFLPQATAYYSINGSLTTPPCTEGVRWFVLKNNITASREQINRLSVAMGTPNNRPVQSINARMILQ